MGERRRDQLCELRELYALNRILWKNWPPHSKPLDTARHRALIELNAEEIAALSSEIVEGGR